MLPMLAELANELTTAGIRFQAVEARPQCGIGYATRGGGETRWDQPVHFRGRRGGRISKADPNHKDPCRISPESKIS